MYLQWKQDANEAEQLCRMAIAQDPMCDIAYNQLAQILCHKNQLNDALAIYDTAINICRTEAEVINIVLSREAQIAQQYVAERYPEAMAKLGR